MAVMEGTSVAATPAFGELEQTLSETAPCTFEPALLLPELQAARPSAATATTLMAASWRPFRLRCASDRVVRLVMSVPSRRDPRLCAGARGLESFIPRWPAFRKLPAQWR